eukprot:scaffold13324_cov56-Attheya_sp.AAC.1
MERNNRPFLNIIAKKSTTSRCEFEWLPLSYYLGYNFILYYKVQYSRLYRDERNVKRNECSTYRMEEKDKDDVTQRTSVKAVSCRRHEESTSLEDREAFIRTQAHHNAFYLFIVNFYAAVLVFGKYLITLETILGSALGVGFTLLAYYRT